MLSPTQRSRYFRRRRTHGKSTLARILDTATLLGLVFLAAYLYLRGKGLLVRDALPLAGLALLFSAVVLRIVRRVAMERFIPQEMDRLARDILGQRLPLLARADFLLLCRRASGVSAPIAFQRAEPVGADELLPLLRRHPGGQIAVCASAGFTKAAQTLAARMDDRIRLLGRDELLDAAMQDEALRPDVPEIHDSIERELLAQQARRKRARALPLAGGGCPKYLAAAGILLLFSFLTRYTLYYRMLAGLCVSIAAARFVLGRNVHTPPVP